MASRSIDLISKNKYLHVQHPFLSFFAVVCTITMPFRTTITSNFLVTHYFYGGIVACAYQRFCFLCSCSVLFFHYRLFFTLLAASCWPLTFLIFSRHRRHESFMFFFQRNSSPLFWITRSNSFFVIRVSVNIKNNVERDSTLLLFFLSKSPGDHTISSQNTSSCLWCRTCLLSYFTLVCQWCGRLHVIFTLLSFVDITTNDFALKLQI